MSAERPIRVGVVGCGEITQVMHLPILHELDAFVPAGLCDLSPQTLSRLGARWGVSATTTDHRELIASPDIEAVLVCTYDHAAVAAEAIAARKHVLVEKPLAFTVDEARSLVVAAEAAGVVAQVGYMKLFDPALERARMRLQEITGLRSITCHNFAGSFARHVPLYTQVRGDDVPASTLDGARKDVAARIAEMLGPERTGYTSLYTLLLMLGSHDLAVLRALFGTPEHVSYARPRGDGQLLAVLEYAGGVPCMLEIGVGASYPWWDEWVAIHGDDECLRIEFPNPYVRYGSTLLRMREALDGGASDRLVAVSNEDPFRREWVEFAACVREGVQTRASFGGALADLELARDIVTAMAPYSDREAA
jgi:predicted dehydrogenase